MYSSCFVMIPTTLWNSKYVSKICENEIFNNDMIKSEEGMNESDKFIPCNSTIYIKLTTVGTIYF